MRAILLYVGASLLPWAHGRASASEAPVEQWAANASAALANGTAATLMLQLDLADARGHDAHRAGGTRASGGGRRVSAVRRRPRRPGPPLMPQLRDDLERLLHEVITARATVVARRR